MVLTPQFWENWNKSLPSNETREVINHPNFLAVLSPNHDEVIYNSARYLNGNDPSKVIREVIQFFKERGKSFTLTTYNHHEFSILEQDLEELGFTKIVTISRMIAPTDVVVNHYQDLPFLFRPVTDEERLSDKMLAILVECFPDYVDSIDTARKIVQSQLSKNDTNIVEFAAFTEENIPMGNGSISYRRDLENVAVLSGAAVSSNYRRQGIYTQLVVERAQHAKAEGKSYLMITADITSSAPIVHKLGFKTVETLIDYHYYVN